MNALKKCLFTDLSEWHESCYSSRPFPVNLLTYRESMIHGLLICSFPHHLTLCKVTGVLSPPSHDRNSPNRKVFYLSSFSNYVQSFTGYISAYYWKFSGWSCHFLDTMGQKLIKVKSDLNITMRCPPNKMVKYYIKRVRSRNLVDYSRLNITFWCSFIHIWLTKLK